MMEFKVHRSLLGCALALALGACTGKPSLPKYASVETATRPSSTENFAALVPDADVVYFPVESVSHGGRSDPAALLLDALRKTGAPISIAWDLIPASQQPLLDELQSTQGGRREELIAQLELSGTGRAREFCRSVLRAPENSAIRSIAIAAAPDLTGRLRSGEALPPEEAAALPRGFRAPAGDFEAFAERLGPARAGAGDINAVYRAHLFAEQFAADRVAQHFASGGGGKLLVFLSQSDLEPGRGVPFFVSQKANVRQLVLGSDRLTNRRTKLLTGL